MLLPAAFQFALKIDMFFALTAFSHLNSISQQRCNREKCKPSAVELKTMFFFGKLCLKSFKSHDPLPLRKRRQLKVHFINFRVDFIFTGGREDALKNPKQFTM